MSISCEKTEGVAAIHGHATNPSRRDIAQNALQTLQVHRLREHVVHRLAHQHVIGNRDIAHDILLAGDGLGNTAASKSSARMR